MKAAEIVNELLETGLGDPEAFLSDFRDQWYTLNYCPKRDFNPDYGGMVVGVMKTIEQALEKAQERRLVKPANLVWIEQSERPDAPEGVFVSTEKTGAVWDVTPGYRAIRRVSESGDLDDPEAFLANLPPAEVMLIQRLRQHGFRRWVNMGDDDDEEFREPVPEEVLWRKDVTTEAHGGTPMTLIVNVVNYGRTVGKRETQVWVTDIENHHMATYAHHITFREGIQIGIDLCGKLERNEVVFDGVHGIVPRG